MIQIIMIVAKESAFFLFKKQLRFYLKKECSLFGPFNC